MRPAVPSVLAAAGLTVLALLVPQSAPTGAAAATPDLTTVVTGQLLAMPQVEAGKRRPVVNVHQESDGWAFGTAVLAGTPGVAGTKPYGWLFLAERSGGMWKVGLEGRDTFAELAKASPLMSPRQREILSSHGAGTPGTDAAGGDYRTGMRLPWSTGATWIMSGGPHGWGGYDSPYSSLDLHGGDQVVRAVRAGTATTMCRGWIRVMHDRGYATDYYHLWNNAGFSNTPIADGTRLGDTGTDVTCGGAASGRHVHFALRQNGGYVGIGGHNVGGWVPIAGGAYGGYALHGSTARSPGGALYNYGAVGFNQGIIDANGGGFVNRRNGPGSGYAIVGSVTDGTHVTVACSANGTAHSGRWGTTSLWNRLTDGTWVTDAFMWTGLAGPVAGYC